MRRPSSLVRWFLALALAVVVADQATKVWALAALTEGERTPLLGDLLGLSLVFNSGAALSIGTGMTWVLTLAAVVVTVVVLRVASRLGSRTWAVALGLLLGGAVGNLVDRLFRQPGFAHGEVVDFIAYADWFVGNVADIAIVVAAGLMILLGLRGEGLDGTRHADGDDAAGAEPDEDDVAVAGEDGADVGVEAASEAEVPADTGPTGDETPGGTPEALADQR